MSEKTTYIAGLYLRLSKDDDGRTESISIGTQRDILVDYCNKNGIAICNKKRPAPMVQAKSLVLKYTRLGTHLG